MSSTNRGTERERDDFYATPEWCTLALLEAVPALSEGPILDPCAGEGAILKACLHHRFPDLRAIKSTLTAGIEINPGRAKECNENVSGCIVADALDVDWAFYLSMRGRHVIMNPPYTHALEFCEKARAFCAEELTICAALLRLNFLGSAKRKSFHNANQADVFVLSKRPSFTGKGTDSIEYAWLVWYPEDRTYVRPIPGPSFGKVTVI